MPAKKKLDDETKTVISDGEKIEDLVRGDGWALAKKKLTERIDAIDAISKIPEGALMTMTPQQIMNEIKMRWSVAELIRAWMADVEGTAEQSKFNKEQFMKEGQDLIIRRLEQ